MMDHAVYPKLIILSYWNTPSDSGLFLFPHNYAFRLSFILNTEAERELEKGKRKRDCFRFPPPLFSRKRKERKEKQKIKRNAGYSAE